jgi:ATP-dependent helicase HrpB
MIDAATKRGSGRAACMTAALLGSGGRREHSDLLAALEEPIDAATQQHLNQLLKLIRNAGPPNQDDDALLQSVLLGFPDRVAQRKAGNQVLLSNGRSAETTGTPLTYSFMVALDAEDRSENPAPLIRLASRIEPEWLLDFFPERVRDETTVVWNRQAERVENISRLLYDKLILHESSGVAADAEVAADLLAQKAIEAGIERFVDAEMFEDLLGRLEFAGVDLPQLSNCMKEFCRGRHSFAELKSAGGGFLSWLEARLDAHRLNELAPRTLRLKSGRQVKIHYQPGKTPWIASRLQDFFGLTDTPRLGPHRTPVVLHLLSPNRQPIQTTTDLEGFWTRLYPQVRRDLMRRYPRHRWPEKHDC